MYRISISAEEIEQLSPASFPGKITVIDSAGPAFEEAVRYLRRQRVLGFDTESRPTFAPNQPHYGVSLLQLSGRRHAYLFRIKYIGMEEKLCTLLSDPGIVKVGAAVHDDVKGLQRYFPFKPQSFVDLQKMVWEYGIRDKSVKKMAAIILGCRISKTQQLSNWEAEVLSASQQRYAATDAWICREMYLKLRRSRKHPLTKEELEPSAPSEAAPAAVQKTVSAPAPVKGGSAKTRRRQEQRRRARERARQAAAQKAQEQ